MSAMTTSYMWKRDGWRWVVCCFYASDVKPPKRPGALAIETRHKSEASKDIEVTAGEARKDIGRVDAFRL